MVLINPCPSIFVWTFTCHYTCSIVLSMQIIIVHPNVKVAWTFVLATLLPLLGQYMVALIFARVMKLFRICSYLCYTILPSILARLHKRFTSSKQSPAGLDIPVLTLPYNWNPFSWMKWRYLNVMVNMIKLHRFFGCMTSLFPVLCGDFCVVTHFFARSILCIIQHTS